MTDFTDQEKAACARREVGQRRRVYGRQVLLGRMTQEKADREIALMEAIAAEYEARAEAEAAKGRLL